MTAMSAKRFNFKNSFDIGERGMAAARDFTMADMEKARADGFAEGKAAGAEEQRATIEQAAATALSRIGERLGALGAEMEALKARTETEALEAVLTIARKLVPHYAEAHGLAEIEGMVRDCLSAVYDEPRVVIRAQDAVLDHVKSRLEELISASGFGGKAVLFADQSLGAADCRVEWADGGAERDVERLWQEIDANISRFLGREPKPDTGGETAGDDTA